MAIVDLNKASAQDLRDEVDRLSSAIQRARHCLEDGRRIGDAIQILKVACPRLTVRDTPAPTGDDTPRRAS